MTSIINTFPRSSYFSISHPRSEYWHSFILIELYIYVVCVLLLLCPLFFHWYSLMFYCFNVRSFVRPFFFFSFQNYECYIKIHNTQKKQVFMHFNALDESDIALIMIHSRCSFHVNSRISSGDFIINREIKT